MKATTPTFVIELPLRVNDQQNRFLTQAFEFGRTLYNATLGTALGQLQRMRESKEWRETRDMPKGKERSERFSELQRTRRLTENGLRTIANNHRKASGRNDIGAHEAQCIGRTVWRALERYLFKDAGKPRFKSKSRGLNSIEGTDNHEIMYKPERQAIVWRKQVLRLVDVDTPYRKEALADSLDGNLYHYRDKSGLECDAVIHCRNGTYGLIEIKLGSEQGIADGVRTLKALADKLDTTKMQKPSFVMVLTALGDFAYQRDDGVLVVPIASLGP